MDRIDILLPALFRQFLEHYSSWKSWQVRWLQNVINAKGEKKWNEDFVCRLFFKSFLSFRNLNIVIIDMKGGIIVLLQPIFYAFIKISSLIADKLYLLRDYKIDVLISSGVEDRVVKAYFDSGNTLCIKKNPVIFIKKGTMKFSEKDEIQVNVDMALPYFPEKVYRVMVTSGIKNKVILLWPLL